MKIGNRLRASVAGAMIGTGILGMSLIAGTVIAAGTNEVIPEFHAQPAYGHITIPVEGTQVVECWYQPNGYVRVFNPQLDEWIEQPYGQGLYSDGTYVPHMDDWAEDGVVTYYAPEGTLSDCQVYNDTTDYNYRHRVNYNHRSTHSNPIR